jgi:AcrR family transcriptional regulator
MSDVSGVRVDASEQARSGASRGGRPRDPALDESIIKATRRRLVLDGYSAMSLGDIAADAGVSRPTIYRRWANKLELTIDALDWGFRRQQDSYPPAPFEDMPAREAFTEAVRRVDPSYFNPDAMVLMGNFMGEALRTPELLDHLKERAVEPRVRLVEQVLAGLQDRGEVRRDLDRHTVATLCFGAYYSAFLRGEHRRGGLAEEVVAVLWPAIAAWSDSAP